MNIKEHKSELLNDPEFRKAYDDLDPIYQLIRKLIAYRIKKGLTQKELAEIIGTKQSSISRLEAASQLPSLSFLKSVADALDLKLQLRLLPK